ncbi:MAG: hypothetical protein ABW068_10380 [Candidatus Thiodiazotropha sp.]
MAAERIAMQEKFIMGLSSNGQVHGVTQRLEGNAEIHRADDASSGRDGKGEKITGAERVDFELTRLWIAGKHLPQHWAVAEQIMFREIGMGEVQQ